ncbi:MAG TPA: hypothetical protein VEZ11_04045 [Thermoanaerobaculia bacterium]|nr:hypothetical protein [Thermoanaerobaculia bacterium]
MKKSTKRLLVGSAIAGGTAAVIGAYFGLLWLRGVKERVEPAKEPPVSSVAAA